MLIKGLWTFSRAFKCSFLLCVLLEPDIAVHARHPCLCYLPHQLELESWTLSLAFCCVFFALCPAINPIPPTTWGFVLLPHLGWGSGRAPLASSVLGISRGNGICDFQGSDPEPKWWKVILAFWFGPLLFCLLGRKLFHSPAVLFDSSDSKSREEVKTGENFMSLVCLCCFNHCL